MNEKYQPKPIDNAKPILFKVVVVLSESVNFPDNGGSFRNFSGLYDPLRGVLITEMKDGTTAEMSIHSANVRGVKYMKQQ